MTLKNLLGISLDVVAADKAQLAKLMAAAERMASASELLAHVLRGSRRTGLGSCKSTS